MVVKQDMKIALPDEIFGIRKIECTVVSNHNVASFIKELVVALPEGEELDFRSMQHQRYQWRFTGLARPLQQLFDAAQQRFQFRLGVQADVGNEPG